MPLYISRCRAEGHTAKHIGGNYWLIHYTYRVQPTIVLVDTAPTGDAWDI